jgi:hypothetical protein
MVTIALLFLFGPGMDLRSSQAGVSSATADTEIGFCYYDKDSARFDSCSCGAIVDYGVTEIEKLKGSILLIDAYSTLDEPRGVEVRRARWAQEYTVGNRGADPSRVLIRWIRLPVYARTGQRQRLRVTILRPGTPLPPMQARDLYSDA